MVTTTSAVRSGKVPCGEPHKNTNQGVGAFSSRESQGGVLHKKGLRGNHNNHIRAVHMKNPSLTTAVKQPKIINVGAVPSSNQDAHDAVAKKGLRQNCSSAKKANTTGGMNLPPPLQPKIEMRSSSPVAPPRGLRVANERRRRKEEAAALMFSRASPIVKGGVRRRDTEENPVPSSSPNSAGNHLSTTPTICAEEEIEISAAKEEIEIFAGTPQMDNSKLVEAMPVAEEDIPADAKDLEEAQLVDLDAIEDAKAERSAKFKRHICLLIITIPVLAGAILMGTLFGRRNSSSTTILTEAPTLVPSMAPTTKTNFPSETPTGVLDSILELLPESTRTSISHYSSPQCDAWYWLAGHPKASMMEDWQKMQLFAMATLYFSFQGDSWDLDNQDLISTWLNPNVSECHWKIEPLSLPGEHWFYRPDLPPPEEAGQSTEFQQPKLYDRNFGLCNEMGIITTLSLDYLEFSGLELHVPGEISLLSSLGSIFLSGKDIHATVSDLIPSELGLLTNLTQIRLDYNELYSTIPTHIGLLNSLEVFDLGDNKFISGRLPTQIGLLSGLSMAHFYLNRLTGNLPSQVGLLSDLRRLSVRDNKLGGAIPTEVGKLGSLEDFWIYNNLFNYIPSQLGLVSTLRRIYAGYNLIGRTIPSELGLLLRLEVLHLHNNYITGTIPTELGALSPQKMGRLSLRGNLLSGAIPTEMSELASLEFLYLHNNQLSGSLPSEFGIFQNMRYLVLNHNLLSGSLPAEMDSAWYLSLHHNRFNGSLPSEIGLFQGEYILLDNNRIGGSLPSELSQFSFRCINLQNNEFSGKVPSFRPLPPDSYYGYPTELNLANNDVSGPVPNGALHSLDLLDIRNTSLTGTIEDDFCSISSLSFDCSAFLCGCSCSCVLA